MSELPYTWTSTSIKTVANLVTGNTPPTKSPEYYGGNVPFVKPGDLDGVDPIATTEQQLTELGAQQSRLVRAGATLVSCIGNLGKVGFAGVPLATNQQINSAEFHSEIVDDRYGYYLCKTLKPWMERESSATTIAILNKGKFGEAPFPLAPLAEQKRIADKLDTVLTRVDAVNTRLARVAPILKRFRQSVLAAATSGRLTEDWRGNVHSKEGGLTVVERDARAKEELLRNNPGLAKKKSTTHSKVNENYLFELPDNWCFSTWGQISEWITYGFTRPMPSTDQGQRLLTAKDVHPFKVRLESSGYTTQGAFFDLSEKDKPLFGDLLITKDGSIGRAALIRTTESFCINQSVAVCWLRSTSMDRNFLEIVANADFTQRFVADMAKGMAIQHLSIVDFACCPVPVPPQNEQTEIVRRVETLFAFADRLEARLQAAQTATERLTPAMLAKAFRGELVPQDPNDEPASELLRRLQQEVPSTNAKRGRKSAA